jgi:hypothetical protein
MRAKAQCLRKCHESTFIYPDTLKHQSPQRGFQNPSKFLKMERERAIGCSTNPLSKWSIMERADNSEIG